MNQMSRRQAILSALFGVGGVGLRAFASGIPAAILLDPRKGFAAGAGNAACVDPSRAQYLIMSTSDSGDPLNGNVPGTYADPGIVHPTSATMARTSLMLAGTAHQAAACWTALPQPVLDRTTFFHHATYQVGHGDEHNTLTLAGAVAGRDMLVSLLASQLGGCLGTVQTQPMSLGASNGNEALSYQGRTQPLLTPASLASVLTLPTGPLHNLQSLRASTLDSLNAWYKTQGTSGQASFIDRYATSQEQLSKVSGSLLNNLAAIKDNSVASQILATLAVIQMNLAPVVTIRVPFGGDNHTDTNLQGEATAQVNGVKSLAALFQQLADANLADRVTFMSLNVFGRTMALARKGTNGRDHNPEHHAAVLVGKYVKGGVVGGVAKSKDDYTATGIDSSSGASNTAGDIPYNETFAALGKTVGRAVGLDDSYLNANITGGKAVLSALV